MIIILESSTYCIYPILTVLRNKTETELKENQKELWTELHKKLRKQKEQVREKLQSQYKNVAEIEERSMNIYKQLAEELQNVEDTVSINTRSITRNYIR